MYFSYSPFTSPSSSASSSAASSPAASHTSTSSYHISSSYQASSPISISSPCAYPSWPTRPSLQSPHAPYSHTAASSYLSDDDLSPLEEDYTPAASPMAVAREALDTAAIRDLLLEESARKKARKAIKVASKSRRRGSGGSERSSGGKAKLSTIIEGSYTG